MSEQETMSERMEKRSCDNPEYLRFLVKSLEEAKQEKDIERIIVYASELERYKILCGNSPAIQLLEESMKRVSEELGLTTHPAIERALSAHPEHLCQCRTCEHEKEVQPPPSGFRAILEHVTGTIERNLEEEAEPQPTSEFRRMLNASGAHETERSLPNPNLEEERRKSLYPPICIETCEFARHCGAYPRNLNNVCVNRFDLMERS